MHVGHDGVDPDAGPPVAVPLSHFLAALPFAVVGSLLAVAAVADAPAAVPRAAVAHLLLVGGGCVVVAGAVTQFLPVWAGVSHRAPRLARLQLPALVAGVTGLAAGLTTARPGLLLAGGVTLAAGLWLFAAGTGLTLWTARPWDRTDALFGVAVAAVVAVSLLGVGLAAGYHAPVAARLGLGRVAVRSAHVTLGVFGVLVTPVVAVLPRLVGLFTRTDDDATDRRLCRVAAAAVTGGVAGLAAGRLLNAPAVARPGAAALLLGVAAVSVAVARRLAASPVAFGPTLRRYAVVAGAGLAWVAAAAPAWLASPTGATDPGALLGPPAAAPLLLVGVVWHVVIGSLYHVVPFLTWLETYSDRVGLEPVPSVDDLYDDRLALAGLAASTTALVAGVAAGATGWARLPTLVAAGGVAVSASLSAVNLAGVAVRHGPVAALLARVSPS